jgi:hypothetical protein
VCRGHGITPTSLASVLNVFNNKRSASDVEERCQQKTRTFANPNPNPKPEACVYSMYLRASSKTKTV